MWALLSTRLRTWLAFAVLIPVVRGLVHHFRKRAVEKNPQGKPAAALAKADDALTKVARRRRR